MATQTRNGMTTIGIEKAAGGLALESTTSGKVMTSGVGLACTAAGKAMTVFGKDNWDSHNWGNDNNWGDDNWSNDSLSDDSWSNENWGTDRDHRWGDGGNSSAAAGEKTVYSQPSWLRPRLFVALHNTIQWRRWNRGRR